MLTPRPARSSTLPFVPLLLALAVLLAAFALRVWNFDAWPPGLSFDEATNGMDSARFVQTGVLPLYMGTGRPEPLYRLAASLTIALVGPTRFGLRLASLFLGILGVAAAYRAGRHFAPPGSPARCWTGLAAAGTLAVMIAGIHLSRVAYRGIVHPFTALMFFDAFVTAWETGRRRAFIGAGLWMALTVMSYTSGLMVLPLAALGLLVEGVRRLRRPRPGEPVRPPRPAFWPGLLALGVAFLVSVSPQIVNVAVQPALYGRLSELQARMPGQRGGLLQELLPRLERTARMVYEAGDINPQYNVAQAPLLHTRWLVALALLGMAACLLHPRRLASWLAVGMLGLGMLPVMLAGEIPHGLRGTGMIAALPLLVAASAGPVLWLADRAARPAWLARLLRIGWALLLAAALAGAGLESRRLYASTFTSDVRWGRGTISAFSWFFETRYQTIAGQVSARDAVYYVPLPALSHPSLRYFLLTSHPRVSTWAAYFGPDAPLSLPPGRFVIPYSDEHPTTFVACMPDGTLVLLPRFPDALLADLNAALEAGGKVLIDPYGEEAARLVDFPAGGRSIRLERPTGRTATLDFAGQVRLVGWDGPDQIPAAGERFEVTLYFAPGEARRRDLYITSQLWTRDYERLASSEEIMLLRWLYPPDQWQAEDIVPVPLALTAPAGLDWGGYPLAVALRDYRRRLLHASGPDGLPGTAAAPFGMLRVPFPEAVSTAGMLPVDAVLGDQFRLLGYRLDEQPLNVTLTWQAIRPPDADYTVFVHMQNEAGDLVAQSDRQPADGRYPTRAWGAGEVFTTEHPLELLPGAAGPFRLYAGMYGWPSLERLPVTQNGEDVPDRRAELGEIP